MKKKRHVKLYQCEECNFLTIERECALCGGKTVRVNPSKIKPSKEKAKGKEKLRFPRLLQVDTEQQKVTKVIEEKCKEFTCPGRVIKVTQGPMVTQYDFSPDKFTRLRKLKSLHEDLALYLEAESVQVQRTPGAATVSITVPNKERPTIWYRDLLPKYLAFCESEAGKKMALPILFGVDQLGTLYVEDLATMPHLLIAGSTGSGKSVMLNGILTSLLWRMSSRKLELVLIDMKSVELMPYKGLPHLKREPISTPGSAMDVLEATLEEVKKRMAFLEYQKVKNLKELNAKLEEKDRLPYIVVCIDELSYLILQDKKEFTNVMTQISSVSRAAGIHVIAAIQRPDAKILSGGIKVNFPARLSFRMPSAPDSRTVLSRMGAEQLLACGDMMYISPSKAGVLRLHSALFEASDLAKMMDLSLRFGHVNRAPADPVEPQELQQEEAVISEGSSEKGKKNGKSFVM